MCLLRRQLKKFDIAFIDNYVKQCYYNFNNFGEDSVDNDLNKLYIPTDDVREKFELSDFSMDKNSISVYFRNVKLRLIEKINCFDVILGCVAWLTDFDILDALAQKQASIIVQKEDFLRPDINEIGDKSWRNRLQQAYSKLKFDYCRHNFTNRLNGLSYCAESTLEPVRCVGNYNRDKANAFPRMHNKFLIFCKAEEDSFGEEYVDYMIKPCAVWTGSFNFTKNAGLSFENALFINDMDIAKAYYNEFGQIAALSEQLNWQCDWVEPEWRIGS